MEEIEFCEGLDKCLWKKDPTDNFTWAFRRATVGLITRLTT